MQFIGAGPAVSLWSTALLLIVLFAAFRIGGLVIKLLMLPDAIFTKKEHTLFSLAVGIILVSLTVLGIGLFGAFTKLNTLTRVNAVTALALFILLPNFIKGKTRLSWLQLTNEPMVPTGGAKIFWLLAAPVLFLSWIQAQMPAGGTDALAYHLFHPKLFVLHHKIFHMPPEFNRESLWPYQTEMLFTLGLLLQGTLLAQLFHWAFYGLTAAAVFLFAERFFGRNTAYLSSLIFLFTPVAFAQSGYAYVDLASAFYTFLALYLFLIASEGKCVRPWFLTGLFVGGAAGTKLLGLGCVLILFFGTLIVTRANRRALLFIAGCVLVSGIWYFRSWYNLGNPVYPFFSDFFHGHGHGRDIRISEGVGMGKGLPAFVFLLWNMALYPQNFGGGMIGPLFLLFLPPFLVQAIRKPSKPLIVVVLFTVLYGGFLFTQSQHARFFLSVVPVMSVAAGVTLVQCLKSGSRLRQVVMAAVALVFLIHMSIFIYRVRDCWSVALGKTSAADYLLTHERSFRGNDYLRKQMKDEEQLLFAGEVRYFYNDNKNVIWDCYPLRVVLKEKGITLTQFLAGKQLDYVWLGEDDDPKNDDEETTKPLWDFVRDRGYKLVYYYQFTEKPTTFYNFIYRLERSPAVASKAR